jgi:dTMP kinase
MIIAFEGIDGSGKSTLFEMTYEYLSKKNKVIKTKEPGGTEFGNQIRNILLNPDNDIPLDTEILLFAADRAYNVKHIYEKYYYKAVILTDRSVISSLVYQGYVKPEKHSIMNVLKVMEINSKVLKGYTPDIVFFIDTEPEIAAKRIIQRDKLDRMEQTVIDKLDKVRQGYKFVFENFTLSIVYTINGNQTPEESFEDIKKELDRIGGTAWKHLLII